MTQHSRVIPDNQKDIEGDFLIDGKSHIQEALSFLKDWVTSIVGIETASIGVIAVFLEVSNETSLQWPEAFFVYLTIILFILSMICGGFVLLMLPGSVQRKPRHAQNDVFSMRTYGKNTIGYWANRFWGLFLAGIVSFGVFIIIRTWPK